MSFSFNTNLDALNALMNLSNVSHSLSASVQRLSSGLRIHSAPDAPPGSVHREAMQAQGQGFQTRLPQSTNASGDIALENISASASSIRDVNAAREVLSLTNSRIVQQADNPALYTVRKFPSSLLKLFS